MPINRDALTYDWCDRCGARLTREELEQNRCLICDKLAGDVNPQLDEV